MLMIPLQNAHLVWRLAAILAGVLLIFAGAQFSLTLPGYPVPQTAQTLAVVVVAVLLAPIDGVIAVALYVLAGSLGLPVFAEGTAGLSILTGPSGGFLIGFIFAAAFLGFWTRRGFSDRMLPLLAGILIAHAIILVTGGIRLATMYGPATAWSRGIVPYLPGALIKTLAATLIVAGVVQMLRNYDLLPDDRQA